MYVIWERTAINNINKKEGLKGPPGDIGSPGVEGAIGLPGPVGSRGLDVYKLIHPENVFPTCSHVTPAENIMSSLSHVSHVTPAENMMSSFSHVTPIPTENMMSSFSHVTPVESMISFPLKAIMG